jgi:hypothetical protein
MRGRTAAHLILLVAAVLVAECSSATCGNIDPVVRGGVSGNGTDCGAGWVYDVSKSAASCAGATCDAGGVDRGTCCRALPDMGSLNNHTCLSLWTNKKVNFR